MCDKIVMIHQGEIIAIGTPEELKENTKTNNLREAFITLAS
ncbi:hypothetical protein Q5M85_20340 [Paraclostridium bifermentans]|nr:hypothetical protein [Paraclostridium bifermentans]